MDKRITISQIAEESGVSIATVSRVMNGTVRVAPDKRQRVEEAIARHDFSPSAMARGLASNQSLTLGIILPDISNPYFAALFLEIERCALEAGYAVLLCNTLFGGSSHGVPQTVDEAAYFQMMIDKQVDGVLITGGQIDLEQISPAYVQALARLNRSMPVVVIGQSIPDTGCLFLERESGKGVVSAISHLRALGHRRIAFVGGQPGVKITHMRLQAWETTLTACGLPCGPELVSLSDYYIQDGYTAMSALLEKKTEFTAFLAINDMVALGALRALADQGKRVPEDVAMISCDQFSSGEYQIPRITGIEQQNAHLGRMAILQLISAIKGNGEQIRFTFTPELVIRESCGVRLGVRHFPNRMD